MSEHTVEVSPQALYDENVRLRADLDALLEAARVVVGGGLLKGEGARALRALRTAIEQAEAQG